MIITRADYHFSAAIAAGLIFGYLPGAGMVTILEIDLEKPIRPQLQIAKRYLRRQRAEYVESGEISPVRPKIRPQKDLYPSYVRILDGSLQEPAPASSAKRFSRSTPTPARPHAID